MLTLMMALALMGGWMRSLSITDTFVLSRAGNTAQFQVVSKSGNLALRKFESELPLKLDRGRMTNSVTYKKQIPGTEISIWETFVFGPGMFRMRDQGCGFGCGTIESPNGQVRGRVQVVPYWATILPLTLVSAWLLLSKPKPQQRAEHA